MAAAAQKTGIAALYQPTIMLALALMAVIVMMILPMPAFMLDIGLAASFGLAILIFTTTLFIERPLDFSAFPTVLLASLMLRLSLNVSSTKLIIGQGHTGTDAAGGVIEGFANFVMGGSLFLGLVVFLVLLIVNFLVITKGAGRMAEVGARFALDAMPGKQLAIDSDLAAGAMTHEEAKARRKVEQEETTFFGSLDGASKFVKGDAIAGLLITALNLIMGLAMGMVVHSMSFSAALETYAILTVGDGLVSQIPSVIISIAAALLLSKGGVMGAADQALVSQLGGHPKALITVGALMALFAFAPGLPFVPFMIGGIALAAGGMFSLRNQRRQREAEARATLEPDDGPTERPLGDMIDVEEIHIAFAGDLIATAADPATGLEARITAMRRHLARDLGFIMPEIRITDDPSLPNGRYVINVQGVKAAEDTIRPGQILVLLPETGGLDIPGTDVQEPVYGAPARWIEPVRQEEAVALGLPVIAPVEVVATHLMETVQGHLGRLFTRRALQKLLDAFTTPSDAARAAANKRLLDDFIPEKVPMDLLQGVLRLLLEERAPIRNLPLILEAVAEARGGNAPPDLVAEHVRRRMGFALTAPLIDAEGTLPLVQIGPEWEAVFAEHERDTGEGRTDVALPPETFNKLASSVREKLAAATARGRWPAVAVSGKRRRFVREVLAAKGVRNPVLSFEEIGTGVKPALVGVA